MNHSTSKLLLACTGALLLFTSCGNSSSAASSSMLSSASSQSYLDKYGYDFFAKDKVPNEWVAEVANKGTVETLTYSTHSYALEAALKEEVTLEKSLNVYLPYGYSREKKYDVVYLLHGTEGEGDPENMANYWLGEGSNKAATTLKVLDYMFHSNKCKDLIIVTPTYYSRVEGKVPTAEQYAALKQELGETSSEWEKDPEQTLWTRFFGQELVNDIIPLVESEYSTHLVNNDHEGIVATRDHRAYAGLSRGSMTSVNSIMMKHMDCFSYIGSFSGIWADFEAFKKVMETTWANYPVKYWYNGNGTADFSLEDHVAFKDNVLSKMSDRFVDGQNYAWVNIKGAAHAYGNWVVQMHNSLLVFFNK